MIRKFGIDTYLPLLSTDDKNLIREAVIFYTGSVSRFVDDYHKTHVLAAGYYATIGS